MLTTIMRDPAPTNPRSWKNWCEILLVDQSFGDRMVSRQEISAVVADPDTICLPIYRAGPGIITDNKIESDMIGIATMKRSKAKRFFGSIGAGLDEMRQEIETLDDFLRGNVWGYRLFAKSGEEVASAWGFFDKALCEKEARLKAKFLEAEDAQKAWRAALEVTRQAHDWAKETIK